ncbi:MAG: DUF2956 domain-containing protein [Methylococcaceae bacterium]
MSKHKNYQKISPETQDAAVKAAKATQRPGQSKEQTKLIAQGIQKGIDHYKKQQKSKSRELNKKIYKVSRASSVSDNENETGSAEIVVEKSSVLPWVLLIGSWIGFAVYIFKSDFV